jgi:serine/threonine-protein kinase HipA
MINKSLNVYVNKNLSGILHKEDDKFIYNYDRDTKNIVSLTMPIRNESWNSGNLHPIFQMNLPEGALKDVIKNRFAKIKNMDDLGFLELVGPYVLGRVKFNYIPKNVDTLELDNILQSNKESLFEELMDKFAIKSGISGVQPKVLLSAHNKTTMSFEHFIVKSWTSEYPQLALNEYFCMRAIKNAELPTPEFYLSDDLSMFIMNRFDVQNNTYLGFEDMCVLTARGTDEKYNGSYEECVRVIKDIVEPRKRQEDLKIFFKALIMNHLLQNGDGHLKNYGIIYSNDFEDATLAPIYDVITTTIYIKNDIPALRLSDGKLWWKEKTYKTFAKQSCNISSSEYKNILEECYASIMKTKIEVDDFILNNKNSEVFLKKLKDCWKEKI